MKEVTVAPENGLLYVYAPMCGTCAIASRMLEVVEATKDGEWIQQANGNFIPDFLEQAQVMSVPALLKIEENQVTARLYAFQSVQNVFAFCAE
ncbi:thioredoxin family protein [Exiguobacterium antarcticum]|uniref:Thioredoxin family protein n=1 Tax=Exiguobacterium antarcticum TaxID=132920 RepID=A0ABT6QZP0_9BACL|nr:thioredoxin family protein [Exiguobacterium antarcticum]AFS71291.1 Thioredoxin [Exiguobacterium antarcticum B7]MDI3233504.1 thioredoxin family protein [Exiguobacterium antarcticum]